MARTKTPAKPTRTRTPKSRPIERSPGEQAVCDKYPGHAIKPGSLLPPAHPDNPFPGKQVVTIVCPGTDGRPCGAERQLCTSDLHHVNACKDCRTEQKKAARQAARKSKPATTN